jgi:DNA-binding beta-propeller fold protein YncE
MALKLASTIEIPNAAGSPFDHGAFDPKTRRVFIAQTGRDRLEVVDHDGGTHIVSLPGFPEAAGVVAADGIVLVTNRGAASLAVVDALSLNTTAVLETGPRPNGVALVPEQQLAIAACIGEGAHSPTLHALRLDGSRRRAIELPGRPRWCVTDAAGERVFLAIREPSLVLVASLPDLEEVTHWPLPAGGAHGMDIDHEAGRLYVACDDRAVVELDAASGKVTGHWPIVGSPDATFFNPATGCVHIAIGDPGLVETIVPRLGEHSTVATAAGAHTTAFAAPDRLYVFVPSNGTARVYADA